MCRLHYRRWWRAGTVEPPKSKTAIERFHESYVLAPAPYGLKTPCWLWTKSLVRRYPQFKVDGKQIKGHRFAYSTFVGAIDEGQIVRHHCDIPRCVNPDHLTVGTHLDNARDRISRGRLGYHKLTDSDVAEIRRLLARGYTRVHIAEMFGVTSGMVGHIKFNRQRTRPTLTREPNPPVVGREAAA
ncbi:hypothetical protein CJ469_05809 [Nocardia farcinica]|nr:hypothetical protein DXT66_25645 [Nocardia farcinica]PFW98848.1 hypothetical protein CJ469_05809 [Nocardia farcinica]PFX04454.1 hypothetical protein CJ468_05430 [Nocardia farcinica]